MEIWWSSFLVPLWPQPLGWSHPARRSPLQSRMKIHRNFSFYMVGHCFMAKNTLAHCVLNTHWFLASGSLSKYLARCIEVGTHRRRWRSGGQTVRTRRLLCCICISSSVHKDEEIQLELSGNSRRGNVHCIDCQSMTVRMWTAYWGDHEVLMRWYWGDIEVILRWYWGDIKVILRW